mmetsp:Transcript_60819/g.131961  ORF Transcript_60819/g.131961 Transcript_60819/m.131961 type:complete len:216 (+) Transcript_60819:2018-2665(+)
MMSEVLGLDELHHLIIGEVASMLLTDFLRHLSDFVFSEVVRQTTAQDLSFLGAVRLAEVAFIREEGQHDEDRKEEEGENALPDLDFVRRENYDDEHHPHVSEHGEGRCDGVDGHLLDVTHFTVRKRTNTDGADNQQIEGSTADDGAGTQVPDEHIVREDLDDAEKDFRGTRAQGHQSQVGHRGVPHSDGDRAACFFIDDTLLRRRDLLDSCHKDI